MDHITMTNEAAANAVISIRASIEHIPLSRLVPSKANVRRVNAAVGVSELADSIEAHGLLHNLTVRKGKKGKYEVVAGSRRLAALRLLAKEGRFADDVAIPCNVREAGQDTELSLAENVQREAMLGSVSQLSCWVRTAVMVLSDTGGTYKGRHADVRVKRSRSEARTTLEAAATPQASP